MAILGRKGSKSVVRQVLKYSGVFLICSVFIIGVYLVGWASGSGWLNYHILHSENGVLPTSLDYASVNQVYNIIKNSYDGTLTTSQFLDGAKSGLAQATGDPYTVYFNPTQAKQFNNQLNESFTGIGAEIGTNSSNQLIVVSPIPGFPADKAGLRPQDIILSINSISTTGMSIDQAVNNIRGSVGTQVTLKIIRGTGNNTQQLTFTITRANITVPSVQSKILDGTIGYIQVSQFTQDTAMLSQQAAQQFKQNNVKGVILDLRDDPGGLLDAAVSLSSLWVPQGKLILQEKRGDAVVNSYTASGNNTLNGIPTVVLINAGSASASEITAGALRDNGVAHLIGVTSFGKGSVQEIQNLPDGSELKVTIAHWYRPNGQNINKRGITPDQSVTMSDSDYKNNLDPQKDAAITWLNQQH